MRFWMVAWQIWQADWTLVLEQSAQQLCPHWKTTERTFFSHSGQLTLSASCGAGLLLVEDVLLLVPLRASACITREHQISW